jgi:hypothetical protein
LFSEYKKGMSDVYSIDNRNPDGTVNENLQKKFEIYFKNLINESMNNAGFIGASQTLDGKEAWERAKEIDSQLYNKSMQNILQTYRSFNDIVKTPKVQESKKVITP